VRRGGKGFERALYDLKRDPEERHNLVREEPARAERMEGELRTWREAHPPFTAPPAEEPLGERDIRILRSLGYLN